MAVSQRARELAIDIEEQCCRGDYVFVGSEAADLIEQALLAERRLAMEIAEKIATDHERGVQCDGGCGDNIAAKLRAAAEKEVGK